MPGLRSLDIRIDYSGQGQGILNGLVLPVLAESVGYDRITSFFTTDSLVAIAAGLDSLYRRAGSMRLVIGIHDVPFDLAQAAAADEALADAVSSIRQRVIAEVTRLKDELARDRLATLAWMMQDDLLEVRVAAVHAADSQPSGIFHNKAMVFRDELGDVVAAVGSPNETGSGLGGNFEHLMVFTSWEAPLYTRSNERFFEDLWSGRMAGVSIHKLDPSFASEMLAALGAGTRPRPGVTPKEAPGLHLGAIIDLARAMPEFSLVSGKHSALFPHQERAYLDALSRWPVRVLLADEVGLGKTFEAGAIVSFMLRFSEIQSVVILAPKAVAAQWQGELKDHFGIDAWVYDSGRRAYLSSEGAARPLPHGDSPLGRGRPRVCILSSQFARGRGRGGHVFDDTASMPDLLVVDEAHSARVRPDISGAIKPTLMWRMLDDITRRIPHVVFATATPMQVHWREYHALLRLLGLPAAWRKPQNYEASLRFVASDDAPSALEDGSRAAGLILSTLSEMSPSLAHLSADELAHVEALRASQDDLTELAERALASWALTRDCLVKLHPAHLLTVRHTRASLEKMGYRFPMRNLIAPSLDVPSGVQVFYMDVETYLSESYFEVEEELYPDKKFNIGFIRCGYQQRLASSLSACESSLEHRRIRLKQLVDDVAQVRRFLELAEEQSDELDLSDETLVELSAEEAEGYAVEEVLRLARIEMQYIDGLLGRVRSLIEQTGDPKLTTTMSVLRTARAAGDQTLVFSRYTDTLDAVVDTFLRSDLSDVGYGVFTGQRVTLDLGNGAQQATRVQIRDALDSGAVRVLFCSDAASEGLNLQAARVLVNVDVPWNPARLEQRIGRVARLGQRASSVDIYNIWYPDSIESRMYQRLAQRKDLYDLAVGEFPEVVADSIRAEVASRLGGATGNQDPITELNKLRNQLQLVALRRLWSLEAPQQTLTAAFRSSLALIICAVAESTGASCDEVDGGYRLVVDDRQLVLHVEPGSERAVSLSCEALDLLRSTPVSLQGREVSIACAETEVPVAFALRDDAASTVAPSDLPRLLGVLLGEPSPITVDPEPPVWLPVPGAMSIPVEGAAVSWGPAPRYWPPTRTRPVDSPETPRCD